MRVYGRIRRRFCAAAMVTGAREYNGVSSC